MQTELLSQIRAIKSPSAVKVAIVAALAVNVIALQNGTHMAMLLSSGLFAAYLLTQMSVDRLEVLFLKIRMNLRGWLTNALRYAQKHPQQMVYLTIIGAVIIVASCTPATTTDTRIGGQPQTYARPAQDGQASTCEETTYSMQAGDNLYRLGLRTGVPHSVLAQVNGIMDVTRIPVGAEIRIPCAW